MSITREKPPVGRPGVEGGVGEKNAHMADYVSRWASLLPPPAVALFVFASNNPNSRIVYD
jgi:hypothetical protein